jgi:predicted pyridoxine 5'-phosphate oxidase superfamily flavin-nucleotide-binding protein
MEHMAEKKESHFARVAKREEELRAKGEEAKITEEMEAIIAKAGSWAIATVSDQGVPNVVPMAFVKVLSKNQLMMVDIFLNKTRTNILVNPRVAVSVWEDATSKGYQFKGKAHFEDAGPVFNKAVAMVKARTDKLKPKAALVIDVQEIFVTSAGADAGKRVAGAPGW